MRRVVTVLAPICAALAIVAAPAVALDDAALTHKLTREMRFAGPSAGAYVRDLDSGRALFARGQDVARAPASVQKLYTTATALLRFGPQERLRTTVVGDGTLDAGGVWRGDLYVRGGGDPTLGRAGIAALAGALSTTAGIERVDGSILGDESLFDRRRGSYDTGFAYDRDIGGVLSALAVRRGFTRDGAPAREAARRLARALRDSGVGVDGPSESGIAPATAIELTALESPPMARLAQITNVPSDNFVAEMLLKALGARFGGGGTTLAGDAVVREQLASLGIHPRVVDGSGLSRANATTPRQVVRLLDRMHAQEVAGAFEDSLPVAGRSGTLRRRMRRTAAQDRCRAKTGTLIGVSALAGLCDAANGHTIAFAFLMTGTSLDRARGVQDRMAAALARYDAPSSASSPASSSTITPKRSAFSSLVPGLAPATT